MDILEALRETIGVSSVVVESDALRRAATATFATEQDIIAIVLPDSVEQVQACVALANRFRIPLYPISRGRNWGLGSRVPVADRSILLDLSRLSRILHCDATLGTIRVEPGVTFRQASDFIQAHCPDHYLAVTGGPADSSLIGNAVERGDGGGPYGDRLTHVCDLEVVLPNGELIRTGMSAMPHGRAAGTTRYAPGPAVDGLFTQSGLGIVTKMTFWLAARPAHFQSVTCQLADRDDLLTFVEAVRPLVAQSIVRDGSLSVWNSYKVLARMGRYPWSLTGGITPMPADLLKQRTPWFVRAGVHSASQEHARADRVAIERALTRFQNALDFTDGPLQADDTLLGTPSDANVRTTYWRSRQPVPETMDPDRDGCGFLWICLAVPFEPQALSEVLDITETDTLDRGFEPQIGMMCVSCRSIHLFYSIAFDRAVEGEDQRARACHDAVLQRLIERGFYPYRLGVQSMHSIPGEAHGTNSLFRALKRGLDPNGILAPGRYEFLP